MKFNLSIAIILFIPAAFAHEHDLYIPEKAPWKGDLKVYVQPIAFANEKNPKPKITEKMAKDNYGHVDRFFQRESYDIVKVDSVKVAPIMILGNSWEYSKVLLSDHSKLPKHRKEAIKRIPKSAVLPKNMGERRNIPKEVLANYKKQHKNDLLRDYNWFCLGINKDPAGVGIGQAAAISVMNGHGVVDFTGRLNPRLLAHEHGHGCGMGHAMRWVPKNKKNPIDPEGKAINYGHVFSPMGHGSTAFSISEKVKADWLDVVDESKTIKNKPYVTRTMGKKKNTYRIYCHNNKEVEGSIGLLINKASPVKSPKGDSPLYYWVSLIDSDPILKIGHKSKKRPSLGVVIELDAYPFTRACNALLLDMSPTDQKLNDYKDPFLKVNQTFTDENAKMSIKVIKIDKDDKGHFAEVMVW